MQNRYTFFPIISFFPQQVEFEKLSLRNTCTLVSSICGLPFFAHGFKNLTCKKSPKTHKSKNSNTVLVRGWVEALDGISSSEVVWRRFEAAWGQLGKPSWQVTPLPPHHYCGTLSPAKDKGLFLTKTTRRYRRSIRGASPTYPPFSVTQSEK